MKILHTADWHIGQRKGPTKDGANLRYMDTINCLGSMAEEAEKEKPDLVCISGDIFDQEQVGPNRLSQEVLAASCLIQRLAFTSTFVVVMRGTPNHDGSAIYAVLEELLKPVKNVMVVTKPQIISTPIANIACIPGFDKQEFRAKFPGMSADEENVTWTQEIGNLVLGLRAQCDGDKPAFLMAHYTVPGCNMESGQTSFFSNFEPVIPRETLQVADFDAVLLGHIHRPQQISGLRNVFYSGAINMLNFNDEGQVRGYYFHFFDGRELTGSRFVETPFREFQTITWDKDEVGQYLLWGAGYLVENNIGDLIDGKIVRVHYSCDEDQKKALNIPVLQSDLYNLGAFYVSEIQPEKVTQITNKGLLSEESDPLANLKKWLHEKCYTDVDAVMEMAEPIVEAALASSDKAEVHGVFSPVSISVKNYRNYKDETFDFTDISFCTINGVNGAGKSSLFMDAILDALYEEPREGYGNKVAWIRATEDARSGSIEFIFDVGEDRFRVTRTRVKSGKGTLNLSQFIEGEWQNRSCEKIDDTQKEILKVLGMDSQTFKSCALIMQDQYGLFLQADKDSRIAILGNLLGLGVYGVMEAGAIAKMRDAKRDVAASKEAVKVKQDFIDSKGDPEGELKVLEEWISESAKELAEQDEKRRQLQATADSYEKVKADLDDIRGQLIKKDIRRLEMKSKSDGEEMSIGSLKRSLKDKDMVISQAAYCRDLQKRIEEIAPKLAERAEAGREYGTYSNEAARYTDLIGQSEAKAKALSMEIEKIRSSMGDDDIDEKLSALKEARDKEKELRAVREQVNSIQAEIANLVKMQGDDLAPIRIQRATDISSLEKCRRQKEFLGQSGCIDINSASCKFLSEAKKDAARITQLEDDITKIDRMIEEYMAGSEKEIEELKHKIGALNYSEAVYRSITDLISNLEPYEHKHKEQEALRTKIAALEAEKNAQDTLTGQYRERLAEANLQASVSLEKFNGMEDVAQEHADKTEELMELKHFLEKEAQLPLMEERLKNAMVRKADLDEQLAAIEADMENLTSRKKAAEYQAAGLETKFNAAELSLLTSQVKELESKLNALQVKKGTLQQKIEDIRILKDEINGLRAKTEEASLRLTRYEILKKAFSQDGVPHQIIRNITPHITGTANSILGSMTGGTMGVEFRLERDGKNGEKAALDVLIDEYGKTVLPYSSKSGGEKVKASLAVILALAEIKASTAGIQLGMLFIDEPPFLDAEGTDAYVDALEAIRQRYRNVRIMAITHDDAMKARFDQSVTVVKTSDEGSKVMYQ